MKLSRSSFLRASLGGAAALATGAVRPAHAKEWTTIRVATEGGYPPFNMTSPNGTLTGFEPELLAELSKRMNIRCELIAQDWDGIIAGLTGNKFDAVIDALSITPKREEVIAFSIPYVSSPNTFVVMKDSGVGPLPGDGKTVQLTDEAAFKAAIAELAAKLKGKTIGVQVSTIQADFLNTYLKDAATIRTYPTAAGSMLDLKAGRVDAVMASGSNLVAEVKKNNGAVVMTGYGFRGGLLGRGSAIGLRKEDPELKDAFDKAIRSVHADGTLKTLVMKWFGYDITPPM